MFAAYDRLREIAFMKLMDYLKKDLKRQDQEFQRKDFERTQDNCYKSFDLENVTKALI